MKRTLPTVLSLFVCVSFVIAWLSPCASDAETCTEWVAKAVSVQGDVQARRAGETLWQPVKLNDTYSAGDTIRVLENSRADIALVNQPVLRMDQNTTITFGGVKEGRSLLDLVKGAAHFFSRATRSLGVTTGFVNAGVEGTEFFAKVDDNQTFLSVFEGKVLASNQAGGLTLASGQSAVAEAGKAPVLRVVARPRDAVRWTLYYPPVLYYRPTDFQNLPDREQAMIRKSIEGYTQGDLKTALESLGDAPNKVR